jgi:hypothetical protein
MYITLYLFDARRKFSTHECTEKLAIRKLYSRDTIEELCIERYAEATIKP